MLMKTKTVLFMGITLFLLMVGVGCEKEEKLSLNEINQLNIKSETLLDINREFQSGLSFRIFECLGYKKKLITTNQDVINYDFYNPNNIYILDKDNPIIDPNFFNKKYEEIPSEILSKYTIEGWFNQIIN